MSHYITKDYESQVSKILQKTQIKKRLNKAVIEWLYSKGLYEKASKIDECANHIGITNIEGIAKIVKADFCRERMCNVCAWRRQSKFTAQMVPVLQHLAPNYDFIFATLTMRSVKLDELRQAIDLILSAYDRLLKHRRIKKAWQGKVRGLEMKYNTSTKTFNPHIHILVAVDKDYFTNNEKYISQAMLCDYWTESLRSDYSPRCDIRKVTQSDKAIVETLKYSFKQQEDNNAMQGFYTALKNRRLVSFSGVFAETRKMLKYSDFENVLTDDIKTEDKKNIYYALYKFDATGGIYSYYKQFELNLKE